MIRSLLFSVCALGLMSSGASAAEFTSPLSAQLPVSGSQRAFPTAEGFGAAATGGRGGSVVHVTNLNNAGAGSLRDAIETQTGARTIVFDVSGIIDLNSNIIMESSGTDDDITIAGQTAPGDGVCTRGGTIDAKGQNLIVRHMCFRRGDQPGASRTVSDGFSIQGSNMIFDHVSVSWSQDEAMQTWGGGAGTATIQYSLFYEPLDGLIDVNEPIHSYGPLLGNNSDEISFHHNVIAHIRLRAPKLADVQDVDVVNNISYNWRFKAVDYKHTAGRQDVERINTIGNVYRRGADDIGREPLQKTNLTNASAKLYFDNNEYFDGAPVTVFGGVVITATKNARSADVDINAETAAQVWATLLDNVGAIVPTLDPIDADFLAEIADGTGQIVDCVDLEDQDNSVLIEDCVDESSFGSFFAYPELTRAAGYDTDSDGMPDVWETAHGLDPNDATDRNGDMVGDGWTNLEYYLNQFAGDYPAFWLPPGSQMLMGVGR